MTPEQRQRLERFVKDFRIPMAATTEAVRAALAENERITAELILSTMRMRVDVVRDGVAYVSFGGYPDDHYYACMPADGLEEGECYDMAITKRPMLTTEEVRRICSETDAVLGDLTDEDLQDDY